MAKFNIQQEDYEIQKKESKKEVKQDNVSRATVVVNEPSIDSTRQEKKPAKNTEPKKEPKAMVFKQKVREKKSVHKSFLITESMNAKFSKLAKMNGYNENEFFIEILNQLFEGYKSELEDNN